MQQPVQPTSVSIYSVQLAQFFFVEVMSKFIADLAEGKYPPAEPGALKCEPLEAA
jgi:hypothetical protein